MTKEGDWNMPLFLMGMIFFIFGGLTFKFFPPKKINYIYGWKTPFAMKNQETWKEAHNYGANLIIISTLICMLMGLALYVFFTKVHVFAGLLGMFISISVIITIGELHLKKVFNANGIRKSVK